jgi:hypothetical protein
MKLLLCLHEVVLSSADSAILITDRACAWLIYFKYGNI